MALCTSTNQIGAKHIRKYRSRLLDGRTNTRCARREPLHSYRERHRTINDLGVKVLEKDEEHRASGRLQASSSSSSSSTVATGTPLNAFWKFLRPHTIRGTILGSVAVVSRVLLENRALIQWSLLPKAALGVLALLCANAFIVGINQIYDVDIDTINKPFLPVAAGEMSKNVAWLTISVLAGLGLMIVFQNFGKLIAYLYTFSLLIGAAYSIPPMRLKQRPVPAMISIIICRGFLLNFGVYQATTSALGLPFEWNTPVLFITSMVLSFALIIAAAKDLPDVKGDKEHQIKTFATVLGVDKVSMIATGILLANYIGAMYLGLTKPHIFRSLVMVGGHGVLSGCLIVKAYRLHLENYTQEAIKSFYRFIWNLFYAEYLLYPII